MHANRLFRIWLICASLCCHAGEFEEALIPLIDAIHTCSCCKEHPAGLTRDLLKDTDLANKQLLCVCPHLIGPAFATLGDTHVDMATPSRLGQFDTSEFDIIYSMEPLEPEACEQAKRLLKMDGILMNAPTAHLSDR